MSLLLDALKRAELAKQIAKAESPAPEEAGSETGQPDAARRVITREKLPDISQPLEILTDDLPSADQNAGEPASPRPELSLQEDPAYQPMPPASAAMNTPPASSGGRTQAEQLFQVKEMEYNPRRPFYLTLAALGLVAVAYGGYAWWQMRPKYSFAPSPTQATSAAAPAQVAVQAPAPPAAPAPAQPAVAPAAAPAASSAVATIPPIQPVRPRQRSRPIEAASPQGPAARVEASPAPAAARPEQPPIAINPPVSAIDPMVERGYQAFQKNDLGAARESYQQALAREPNNRDALLGLAAIEVRSGRLESAEARYLKLLELDPRDSQAVAGLIALRGRTDPVGSESRLKTLIQTQPEVAQLYFSLGNQYAHQSRWSEAQAAFFKAYSIDSENADFAYNLAVSLDQLRQKKSALEYYRRALTLADKRAGSFDPAQARQRVQELSK
jgi:tetratricopeptide (TPR) repeat protein